MTPGPNVRNLAFQALQRIELEQLGSQQVVHEFAGLLADARDRALLQTMVLGVLRHRLLLDWLVETKVHRPGKLQLEVLQLLRLGVYQLLFLSRIPGFAVVNEMVELAKKQVHQGAASLLNAILRKFANKNVAELVGKLDARIDTDRAILDSHPLWLMQRWKGNLRSDILGQVLACNNAIPPLFLRDLEPVPQAAELTPGLVPVEAMSGSYWLTEPSHLLELEKSWPGRFLVQDLNTQWTALQMKLEPEDTLLDACCGRGGKMLTILSNAGQRDMTETKNRCFALDLSFRRLEQFRERLARSRQSATFVPVHLCCWDIIRSLPSLNGSCQKIVLDAPCSNTGVIRRHPEIKWRLTPQDITRLSIIQKKMIELVANYLSPGGHLLYIVCSLEPEEGPDVVKALLEQDHSIRSVPLGPPSYAGCLFEQSRHGWITLYPSADGGDGFFVAQLQKRP